MTSRHLGERTSAGAWTKPGVAIVLAIAAGWAVSTPQPGFAQRSEPAPKALEKVGIDEKLNAQLPLDLPFRDENGREVKLGSLFSGQRPVALVLYYSDCPLLCTLVLNGIVDSVKELSWTPGAQFEIVALSIDPSERPERARKTKTKYLRDYGRPETAGGWHFLTGREEHIRQVADAVGFRYTYVAEQKQYAHAAVLTICTPDGRVSRYLYGVQFPEQTLKLSLVEAGEGKVGSTLDKVLLYCFHYDAESGRYGPVARNMMKLGGAMMVALMLAGFLPYWLHRRGRGRHAAGTPETAPPAPPRDTAPHAGLMLLAGPLAAPGGSLFFPQRSSTDAVFVDQVFHFIFFVSVFFFALIVGLMIWFVLKYRRVDEATPEKSPSHSNLLEATWSIIPAILVTVMFVWGFIGYMDMRQAPDNSYEIQVTAKKWAWSFTYPNGHIEPDLHVPIDRPIRLVMTSDDVIHSLYIPAFRLKMDVVPGRYTTTWFQATEAGEHTLFCTEYCGTQHSAMLAKVVVHPSGEFETWLAEAADFLKRMPPEKAGELLYQRRGCAQCHTIDGGAKTGPSFKGTFGTKQMLADGGEVLVNENYIRESILDPQAKVRAGYKPAMPTYRGQLKDEEITAIIAYLKTLK